MEDDVLICSGCGSPARAGQEFCRSCGSPIREDLDPVKLVINLEPPDEVPGKVVAPPEKSGEIELSVGIKTLPDDLAHMIDSTPTHPNNPRVINDYQVKINRVIGLEILAALLLLSSSLTVLFLLLNSIFNMVEMTAIIYIFIALVAVPALCLGVYFNQTTRIYYVIDLRRQAIILHRTAFGKTTERIYRRFDEIAFITVQGTRYRRRRNWKSQIHWMYVPCMVSTNGKKLNLVYGIENYNYAFGEQLSRRMAEVLGIRFIAGKKEHYSRILKDKYSGKYTAEHLDFWSFWLTLYRDPAAKYLAVMIVFNLLFLYLIYTKREIFFY